MSTTAFGLGSKYFALYEVAGVGIQWRTINQSPVEGDDFNLGLSMMMLIIDAAVYGVLTWYIEAVHPGKSPPIPGSFWGGLQPSLALLLMLVLMFTLGLGHMRCPPLYHRDVRPATALVLPPPEVLLVGQRAC